MSWSYMLALQTLQSGIFSNLSILELFYLFFLLNLKRIKSGKVCIDIQYSHCSPLCETISHICFIPTVQIKRIKLFQSHFSTASTCPKISSIFSLTSQVEGLRLYASGRCMFFVSWHKCSVFGSHLEFQGFSQQVNGAFLGRKRQVTGIFLILPYLVSTYPEI